LYLDDHPGADPAQVMSALLDTATERRLENIGFLSPNLLIYSLLTVFP
jgi:hypothetical protein